MAAGSYFIITGPLVLLLEKKSSFVKFHALQSTLGFALLLAFYLAVKYLNLTYLAWAPGLVSLAFTILMMLKAYYGEEYRFPLIGNLAFHAVYDAREDLLAVVEDDDD